MRIAADTGGDETAAGVMILTRDGLSLFLKRSGASDHAGEWCVPGGRREPTDPDVRATAYREVGEEVGQVPEGTTGAVAASSDDFATFFLIVDEPFLPTLNDEHVGYAWAPISDPPQPLHPNVGAVLAGLTSEADGDVIKFITTQVEETPAQDSLAMDRDTVRSYDVDGRLHVELTNISKANVCPYYGKEIPGWKDLGLEPERKYQLYRDPAELVRGASTFNNIPLLARHEPVSAEVHRPELVIGSTGTDAEFVAPFLRNSLVIWSQDAILAVEGEYQKELSSAYRYRADMTPGIVDGESYDGVMRDIVGNHVALVREGRAGPDVVVGDAAPPRLKGLIDMTTKTVLLSRTGALAKGALLMYLMPKLAQDAKVDLNPALDGLTSKNFKERKGSVLAAIRTEVTPKLAKDADITDVTELLDALEECAEPEAMDTDPPTLPAPKVAGSDADPKEFLKGKLSAEDMATYDAMCSAGKAADAEEDEDKKKKEAEKAMDSAVKTATDAVLKNQRDLRAAEKAVRPYVGELSIACDSAEDVYRNALSMLGVDVKDVHPSAFSTILGMQTPLGARKVPRVAQDSAGAKSFAERFPSAARINVS